MRLVERVLRISADWFKLQEIVSSSGKVKKIRIIDDSNLILGEIEIDKSGSPTTLKKDCIFMRRLIGLLNNLGSVVLDYNSFGVGALINYKTGEYKDTPYMKSDFEAILTLFELCEEDLKRRIKDDRETSD